MTFPAYGPYYAERAKNYLVEAEPTVTKASLDTLITAEGLAKSMKFGIGQIKLLLWLDLKIVQTFSTFLHNQMKQWKVISDGLDVWELAKRTLALRKEEHLDDKKFELEKIGIVGVAIFRGLGFVKNLGELGLFSLSKLDTTVASIPVVGGALSYFSIKRFGAVSLGVEVAAQIQAIWVRQSEIEARYKVLSCIQSLWAAHQDNALRRKHGLGINEEDVKGYAEKRAYLQALSEQSVKIPEAERKAFQGIQQEHFVETQGRRLELEALLEPLGNSWVKIEAPEDPIRSYHLRKWTKLQNIESVNWQRPWVALISAITKLFAIVIVGELFPIWGVIVSSGADVLISESIVIPNVFKVWLGRYNEHAKADMKMPDNVKSGSSAAFQHIIGR